MERLTSLEAPPANAIIGQWIDEGRFIEIDLGCGRGLFITRLAAASPERRFVGVERQAGRVDRCQRKARTLALENACFSAAEILEVLETAFRPASADIIHVMFPDPWPKRKHHARRLINQKFMDAVSRVLKPGGTLRFMTDDEPYFVAAMRVFLADQRFQRTEWEDGREYPKTDFQRIFEEMGRPFHFSAWRRCVETASS